MTTAFGTGLALGFLVALPIGPIGLMCVRSVLAGGVRPGILIGLGAALVDVVYAALGVAGVGTLLAIDVINITVGVVGALVLGWIGVTILRAAFVVARSGPQTASEGTAPAKAFRTAVFATAANPATIAYWGATFAAASAANIAADWSLRAVMLGGIGLGTFGWFMTLTLVVATARSRLSPKIMAGADILAAVGILGFAALLAVRAVTS